MIALLILYLLFQVGYDQWGDSSQVSSIIYYSFQWLWVAGIALHGFVTMRKTIYLFICFIFTGLAVNELLCLGMEDYGVYVNSDMPVFGLTIITFALFILHEIIQWRNRKLI